MLCKGFSSLYYIEWDLFLCEGFYYDIHSEYDESLYIFLYIITPLRWRFQFSIYILLLLYGFVLHCYAIISMW